MNYIWDKELNLFRHADVEAFGYSDGAEVEQRLFDIIRNAVDRSTFSPELVKEIADWPSEYHLSRARHCLIRPLGIKPGEKVLELGCGCGAITRYLGEIGAEVTAVEGSISRARIAAERCLDLSNVKVFVDDLLRFETDECFDWILLIGVLEYAPVFTDEKKPAQHYLRTVARFLAPDGKLVIAIENKLGLKYFNGCSEDHLGVPFFGLQNLYSAKTPCTFGRRELLEQLSSAGFLRCYFYYPFPDYKLPSVILSDDALKDPQFDAVDLIIRSHARDYSGSPYRLFDEALVFSTLSANGLIAEFSNSFLVVATLPNAIPYRADRLAMTFAVNRVPEFSVVTSFYRSDDVIHVVKEPVFPDFPRERQFQDCFNISNVLSESIYHPGRQMLWRLLYVRADRGTLDQIVAELCPWVVYLLQFATINGSLEPSVINANEQHNLKHWFVPGIYLDCTPFNLIESNKGLTFIDNEWQVDRDIPLGWVITRGVLHSLSVGLAPGNPIKSVADVIQRLCISVGLSITEAEVLDWLNMEARFQSLVTNRQLPNMLISPDHSASPLICLNQALAERDGQISNLNQIINERDELIANINRIVAEREEQIASLNQAVIERDLQITNLNQVVVERDEQIVSLKQVVAERDMLTAKLQQITTERDAAVANLTAVRRSMSWRITAPMRFIGLIARGDFTFANHVFTNIGKRLVALLPINVRSFIRRQVARLLTFTGIIANSSANYGAIAAIVVERFKATRAAMDSDPLTAVLTDDPPHVDISVVTYNSSRWVTDFADSLIALDYPKSLMTIRFVDNNSTDNTVEMLQAAIPKLQFAGFTVEILQRPNHGYGAGHNVGIRAGNAPFCLVTNVDLTFERDALTRVVATAVADDDRVAAWELRQKPYEHPKFYDPVTGITNWNSHACVLLRRSAFDCVGGYDETLFMYGEDVELSYRLRRAGLLLRYCPAAVVYHYSYENIDGVKPLQYIGSTFANLYLRLIYGNLIDTLAVPLMAIRLLLSSDAFPGSRLAVMRSFARLARVTPRALLGRRYNRFHFPFRTWDYEMIREGAFISVPSLRSDIPLVSVITRTYRGRDVFLRQALLSVAHQTYPAIEHVVVEDGGDTMREVVENIAKVTGRPIHFIALNKVGRSAAGNAGLAASTGRWCLFLDDDDLLFADHIEVLVNALHEEPDAVASYSLAWEVVTDMPEASSEGYQEITHGVPVLMRQEFDHAVLVHHNFMPIQSVLFERRLFVERGGFYEDMDVLEDWVLWMRYAQGNHFVYVPKLTSLFRTPSYQERIRQRQEAFDAAYPLALARAKAICLYPVGERVVHSDVK